MRVTIRGIKNKEERTLIYEMIDYYDKAANITAMMRTTAYPTSIIAQMLMRREINARGVQMPEECTPLQLLIKELEKRNIIIKKYYR